MRETVRKKIKEISQIAKKINDTVPSAKIYACDWDDWDDNVTLCILLKDVNTRKRDLLKKIRKSIATIATIPLNILLYDQDEFLQRANLTCTFEHVILSECIEIRVRLAEI